MSKFYSIPGYLDNFIIEDNKIKNFEFQNESLYEYKNGMIIAFNSHNGEAILLFKNSGIYTPNGNRIFGLNLDGEVIQENGLFHGSVGFVPKE